MSQQQSENDGSKAQDGEKDAPVPSSSDDEDKSSSDSDTSDSSEEKDTKRKNTKKADAPKPQQAPDNSFWFTATSFLNAAGRFMRPVASIFAIRTEAEQRAEDRKLKKEKLKTTLKLKRLELKIEQTKANGARPIPPLPAGTYQRFQPVNQHQQSDRPFAPIGPEIGPDIYYHYYPYPDGPPQPRPVNAPSSDPRNLAGEWPGVYGLYAPLPAHRWNPGIHSPPPQARAADSLGPQQPEAVAAQPEQPQQGQAAAADPPAPNQLLPGAPQ